jgi:hypothetical protein
MGTWRFWNSCSGRTKKTSTSSALSHPDHGMLSGKRASTPLEEAGDPDQHLTRPPTSGDSDCESIIGLSEVDNATSRPREMMARSAATFPLAFTTIASDLQAWTAKTAKTLTANSPTSIFRHLSTTTRMTCSTQDLSNIKCCSTTAFHYYIGRHLSKSTMEADVKGISITSSVVLC